MWGDENDPVAKTYVSAFTQALAGLGWTDGRNVRIDLRWYGDDINRTRALAKELVGSQPDIILAAGATVTAALQRETRSIPIVFTALGASREAALSSCRIYSRSRIARRYERAQCLPRP
jgi:putative ABC transport system substrate-binding protein